MAISLEQYKQLREQGMTPTQIQQIDKQAGNKDWWTAIDKAGKTITTIFPGRYIGETIGTQIAKLLVKPEQKQFVSPGPSPLRVGADIGQIGLTFAAPLTTPAKTIAGRIGFGAAIGAGAGLTQALKTEKPTIKEMTGKTIGGAIVGTAIAGVFETIGVGLRALSNSNFAKRLVQRTYAGALRPPTKELTKEIERGFTTTGEKIAAAGYKGGLETMRKQAVSQLEKNGTELEKVLAEYPKVRITAKQVLSNTSNELEDVFGALDERQIATIQKEIAKIPSKMNLTELLNQKRLIDKKIDPTFWIEPNERKAFVNWVRYLLRGNMKTLIENSTDNVVVKQLNQNMSLAMDVRHLSSLQEAIRMKGRDIIPLGRFSFISNLLDKTIFNPVLTTRIAQTVKGLGQKTGQTPLRQILRAGTIIKTREALENK